MLDVALKFEKAFTRYEEEDDKFLSYFLEKENGKKMIGPPTCVDWECATVFVKFLSIFYEVTLKFSSTLQVTSNNFYHEICEIHTQLSDSEVISDPLLSGMAVSMKEKYNKYWGTAENINPLLFLAVVRDPRYNMRYLKFCFDTVYNAETVAKLVVKVESVLQCLYACYDVEVDGKSNKDTKLDSLSKSDGKETRRRLLESYLQYQQTFVSEKKNDLERYLVDEPLNPMIAPFDILQWWKANSGKYKILSMMARDVLAIPVLTVASESTFSTSGRILDSFRSSLSPKMVEALVCTQSWLRGNHGCLTSRGYLDETHIYDFLDKDNVKKTKKKETSSKENVVNVDD
ncbi:zinc finger BED domain-containing protein RICESLEEPER 2-like [Apium graveolens]|uniref:zinc finger BED domain-containing protein RICESLEEPER 2-like n=1 Tax=Apium graveolens TaxID=4045 RepID=UPI003D7BE414